MFKHIRQMIQQIFLICLSVICLFSCSTSTPEVNKFNSLTEEVILLNYNSFSLMVDCSERVAFAFRYETVPDTGNFPRSSSFHFSQKLPKECQQHSISSYSTQMTSDKYDRGHLVPANHMDHSKVSIFESNEMSNILPQTLEMNRGAWLETEEFIECQRDVSSLVVMGGAIWLNFPENDYFISTHGIRTPEFYWKLVLDGDKYIAWLIPNAKHSSKGKLQTFVTSVDRLEELIQPGFPLPKNATKMDMNTWKWNHQCDKS